MTSTSVAHHDESREGVGRTAFGVACLRAYESRKREDALFHDRFAELLESRYGNDSLDSIQYQKQEEMVKGLAVRTRKIDEEMIKALQEVDQVVLLGAGLDFRAWRLHEYVDPETAQRWRSTKKWFEVDFAELFKFKLKHVADCNAESCFEYVSVVSDISLGGWDKDLEANGYHRESKTVWLLEGFTGYLTEEELRVVMRDIRGLSADGSKMIATFLGDDYKAATTMHRFKTRDLVGFVAEWGWKGNQTSFIELSKEFERENTNWKDYFLALVTLSP